MMWNKANKEYSREEQHAAYEMVKANKVEEMNLEELGAALAYADELDFMAEMSDWYKVTLEEKAATYKWAVVVAAEYDRRAA